MSGKLFVAFLKGIAWIPRPLALSLSQVIGWLLWFFPTRNKAVSRINIALCFPEQSAAWREQLLRKNLVEMTKSVFDTLYLWRTSLDNIQALVKSQHGAEQVYAAAKAGKGIIIATPHLGAWEILGFIDRERYPLTAMYQPPQIAAISDWVRSVRQRFGARLVPTDIQGVKAITRALRNGSATCILPDQVPLNKSSGVFAPFFGHPANTMLLVNNLARKRHIPVFFCSVERIPGGFHLHYQAAPEALYDPDPLTAATALNQAVEQLVRRRPEQYLWSYKRFKDRQPGEPDRYRESKKPGWM